MNILKKINHKKIEIFFALDLLIQIFQNLFTPTLFQEIYNQYAYPTVINFYENPPLIIYATKLGIFLFGNQIISYRITLIPLSFLFKLFLWKIISSSKIKKYYTSNHNDYHFILIFLSIPILNLIFIYHTIYAYILFFSCLFIYLIKLKNDNFIKSFFLIICAIGFLSSGILGIYTLTILILTNLPLFKSTSLKKILTLIIILAIPFLYLIITNFNLYKTEISFNIANSSFNKQNLKTLLLLIILLGPLNILIFIFNPAFTNLSKTKNPSDKSIYKLLIGISTALIISLAINTYNHLLLATIAFPFLIILLGKNHFTHINPIYKKTNNFFIISFIIYTRLFNPQIIIKETQYLYNNISSKDVQFISELLNIPNNNTIVFNNPKLATLLHHQTQKTIGLINTFWHPHSDYSTNHNPITYHHKKTFLLTTNTNLLTQWDTIFYKNKNIFFKQIDTFYYWQNFHVNNISFIPTDSNTISLSLQTTIPFYAQASDLNHIQPIILLHPKNKFKKNLIIHLSPPSINPISPNTFQINTSYKPNLNINPKTYPYISISFLQNGELLYNNSPLIPIKNIGL